MNTFLLYGDALHSPEMRHEIGEPIGDPLTFIEHEGTRIVVGSVLEAPILARREDVVDAIWTDNELGKEDLVRDAAFPLDAVGAEILLRALRKLGVSSAVIPPNFPVAIADYVRQRDIELVVDRAAWATRRRRKTPSELEGIERAQRAADTAMLTAARMLREAEPTSSGTLKFDGEILTAEWIREAMESELLSQGAESQEVTVQSGDACLDGHDIGHGPIRTNESCIIDCFPRDRRSGAYTDMTRTFVPGRAGDELKRLHRHCREALDIALEALLPGSEDAYRRVADYFHSHGFPTQAHNEAARPIEEGFWHSLGHGVGLEVHEKPFLGRRSDELAVGDVVAVEPGLYFKGIGGIRLEDTVLVTASGPERFTDSFPYELEP